MSEAVQPKGCANSGSFLLSSCFSLPALLVCSLLSKSTTDASCSIFVPLTYSIKRRSPTAARTEANQEPTVNSPLPRYPRMAEHARRYGPVSATITPQTCQRLRLRRTSYHALVFHFLAFRFRFRSVSPFDPKFSSNYWQTALYLPPQSFALACLLSSHNFHTISHSYSLCHHL